MKAKPQGPVPRSSTHNPCRTPGPAEQVGYDAGKKIRGRKRHILVDSLGILIGVLVTSAYVSDIAGATNSCPKPGTPQSHTWAT